MNGPPATARPATPPQMQMTAPRRWGANADVRMVRLIGMIMAADIPCSTRAPIRVSTDGARAHIAEAALNSSRPTMKIRRRPKRSPWAAAVVMPADRLRELGDALGPIVFELGLWGAGLLAIPKEDDQVPTAAIVVAMRVMFKPVKAAGVSEDYELHVDGHVFKVRVEDGQVVTREGFARPPSATFTLDGRTLLALLREGLEPRDALAARRVLVDGKTDCLARFVSFFAKVPEVASKSTS